MIPKFKNLKQTSFAPFGVAEFQKFFVCQFISNPRAKVVVFEMDVAVEIPFSPHPAKRDKIKFFKIKIKQTRYFKVSYSANVNPYI